MTNISRSSIQLWILALFAVRLALCESSSTPIANITVLDVDQLLNVSCSEDSDCFGIHFAAVCKVANIDYDDSRNVILERECGCDTEQRFFRREDSCVYHSPVLGNCDVAEVSSVCEDPLSECRPSSDGTGILSCECKIGTILVEYNRTKKCAYEIDAEDDPNCELCLLNNGVCFALQQDGLRDGCACPPSYSGENCAVENVKVKCSSREMRICYTPHDDINVEEFTMSTSGKLHVASCRARRSSSVCGEGQYLLSLPLQEPLLDVCGTQIIREAGRIKYTATIVIQNHPEPSRIADRFLHTFCSFTRLHDISSVGLTVNSYTDTEVGQEIRPLLSLSIRNTLGGELDRDKTYRVGDHVYLHFFLSTENGYTGLRVDGCTLSSSGLMPDARADTLRVLHNGCPVAGQTFITKENNFYQVQNQPNELQTGLVQLRTLKTGRSLHIHCTLKLCIKGYDSGCEPVNCPSEKRRRRSLNGNSDVIMTDRHQKSQRRRDFGDVIMIDKPRRRRSVESVDDVMVIDMHAEIKLQEDTYHTEIVGMTLTSIALAVIVFIILVAVVTLAVAQARTKARQKKRHKEKKQKLVKSRGVIVDMLNLKDVPSHMTESEV